MAYSDPLAYYITIRTYGTWEHGDERGSVDRVQNEYDTPRIPPNEALARSDRAFRADEPYIIDAAARGVIEKTIREVCVHRGWVIVELNVRTNHLHIIVRAGGLPERVMNDLKSWCTRRLREAELIGADRKVWARHGSTRWIFRNESLDSACFYVRECQGGELPWVDPDDAGRRPDRQGGRPRRGTGRTD